MVPLSTPGYKLWMSHWQPLWIPPTVAMMGVLASSRDLRCGLPAALTVAAFRRCRRIPVTGVSRRFTSKERDVLKKLVITQSPSTGIVVWTEDSSGAPICSRPHQCSPSGYLPQKADFHTFHSILFEQNVQATWNRFKGLLSHSLQTSRLSSVSLTTALFDESTQHLTFDQNVFTPRL